MSSSDGWTSGSSQELTSSRGTVTWKQQSFIQGHLELPGPPGKDSSLHCGCDARSSPARSIPSRRRNRGISCRDRRTEDSGDLRASEDNPKVDIHLMTASSTCIRDVAVDNLPRSTSLMLLEVVRKLLLMDEKLVQKERQ